MTQEMKAKREQLKELSKVAKLAIKTGLYDSINEAITDIYREQGHTELHSFRGWLKKGFAVKKGEKALLLWGQPKESTKQEPQESPEDGKSQFWPLAYVFSQNQVEPLKKTA